MCDNCQASEIFDRELSDNELGQIAIATIGGLIETYLDEGYCDPGMYQALEIADIICARLGAEEMRERLVFTKIRAGEVINDLIERGEVVVDEPHEH